MQGINQLHNEIKNLSDQQLVQLMQDPRSTLPKYMVLAEIEGRKPVRQAFDAANVQQPMMTIADESVQEFIGGNPMPSAPMMGAQGFASGKSTAREALDDYNQELKEIYEKQQRYRDSQGKFFNLRPRDYIVSDEEYNRMKERGTVMGEGDLQDYRPLFMLMNLLDGESGPRFMPESKVKGLKAKIKASQVENKLNQMGMASGGLTGYQEGGLTSLGQDYRELITNDSSEPKIPRGIAEAIYLDEEGNFDPLKAAAFAGTMIIPGGAFFKAFQLGNKIIKAGGLEKAKNLAGKGLQTLAMKPNPKLGGLKAGQRKVIEPSGKKYTIDTATGKVIPEMVLSKNKLGTIGGIGSTIGYTSIVGNEEKRRLEELYKEQQKRLNADLAKVSGKSGLNDLSSAPVKSDRNKMSGLELAQLGGIIAGSVDLSDLGKGIGLLATEKAKNKRDAALAERKLGIDERRVTAMEEANILKQNQFLIEQLTAQMEVDYPAFIEYNKNIEKNKTSKPEVKEGYDRYVQNLAQYRNIMGMGVASNNNDDDAFASQYITQAG